MGGRLDHVYGPSQIPSQFRKQAARPGSGATHRSALLLSTSPAAAVPWAPRSCRPTCFHPLPALGTLAIIGQSILPGRPMSPDRTSNLTQTSFSRELSTSGPASPTPKLISCHRDIIRLVPPVVVAHVEYSLGIFRSRIHTKMAPTAHR